MNYHWKDVLDIYENKDNPYYSWKGLVINALSYPDIYISVNDGEEWQVSKSRSFKQIREAIESVDESSLAFWSTKKATKNMFDKDSEERHSSVRDGKRYWLLGYAYVNLFNSLEETVYDSTYNDYLNLLCSNPNYVNRFAIEEDV